MDKNKEDKLGFFIDGTNALGFFFGGILYFVVFSYVFIGLFTFETPIASAILGIFLGMFVTCMVSPFCAGIGFLLGAVVSGLLTWYEYRTVSN